MGSKSFLSLGGLLLKTKSKGSWELNRQGNVLEVLFKLNKTLISLVFGIMHVHRSTEYITKVQQMIQSSDSETIPHSWLSLTCNFPIKTVKLLWQKFWTVNVLVYLLQTDRRLSTHSVTYSERDKPNSVMLPWPLSPGASQQDFFLF